MSADTKVFQNAYFSIDGQDVSAQVKEATLNFKSEMLDRTAIADNTRNRRGGLFDWSIAVKFLQSYNTSIDGILFAGIGTSMLIELRPLNACTTGVNPRFFGVAVPDGYQPLAGAVGALIESSITFQSAGSLTRSTTAT